MAFSSYGAGWQQLNEWLHEHREFWRPAPFTSPAPDWTLRWPDMARQVSGFSDDDCQRFENDPVALASSLAPLLPSLSRLQKLTDLPMLTDELTAQACTLPEVRARDMPGRKRLQSGAFSAALRPLGAPVVDWCCGKGHLARTLLPFSDHPVTGYDWSPALVDDGNRLAQKAGDAVRMQCQDVMADDLLLPDNSHGVALHACGDLHRRLLRQGTGQSLPRLSIAPCCYHLSEAPLYRPLSQAAAEWAGCLRLDRADLKLAVEETVTAPARVRDQVQRFSRWRLGFDGLQRELRQVDDYLPVPSHPNRIARGNFREFCGWAAEQKGLSLPDNVDYPAWEAYGASRLAQVRRHELIRHLFRRPLELWLVLDYALFLEEQGYRVRIGTFCQRHLTPRNLLIDARLEG
ncbi:methyltransferase [Marinobacter halotolerans]|uniref:methyltransferase n=1 Tax=Marinobacter halotolerans TaxID=1569211 RepID=UPI001CD928B7|nr:methyltransferase [Marinobacter halotolerans]